jgi:diguanylate cyclase (GGDEF)-like protein/PAS domain S-box-containing protein
VSLRTLSWRVWKDLILRTTEHKRAKDELQKSEARYRAVVNTASDAIITITPDGMIRSFNSGAERIFGYRAEEVIGQLFTLIMPERFREQCMLGLQRYLETHESRVIGSTTELIGLRNEGSEFPVELSLGEVHEAGERLFAAIIRDITERKQSEEALRQLSRQNEMVLNSAGEGIFGLDLQGKTTFINPAAAHMTGWDIEDLLGQRLHDFLHHSKPDGTPYPQEECPIYAAFKTGATLSRDNEVFWRKDGTHFPVEYVSTPIIEGDKLLGAVVTFKDITERKALEQKLQYQAFHDPLTDLPNRASFMDRLGHVLTRADQLETKVAVLFTDLDNFKIVNDSLGHKAGDQLLIAVADRLKTCLRPEDIVARLGGDEFTILLEGVASVSDAAKVAERIAEKLQPPFVLDGQEVFATTSTGIAVSNAAQGQPTDLLRHADLAMYRAKSKGKACHEVFEPSMSIDALERLELETELRRALGREEFRVYYQPEILLESGEIVGMEALVRWEHPGRGLLLPQEFLSIAEESNLILSIGQWVLREACNQLRTWQEQYPSTAPLVIGVNLSTREFFQPSLIAEILRETGVDPQTLQLEITEGAVAYNHAQNANNTLWDLKALGVQLAIDDFGMGYSSLSYLKRFPVNVLKIDRSFVRELGKDPKDTKIVAAIIHLARALDLRVIAEGVETAEQVEQLRKMECEVAQGYYFSEPLPSEAVSALLQQQRS